MKTLSTKLALRKLTGISFLIFLTLSLSVKAQVKADSGSIYQISLTEAIKLSKAQNNLVKAALTEESATGADLRDAKNNALPTVLANGDYERYSKLTLFQDGLKGAKSISRYPTPNAANLGVSTNFNLYAGSFQRAYVSEHKTELDLARINSQNQASNSGLQVAQQYLDMVKLYEEKKFIIDQVVRAETRLKNITALYNNQKVTRSDVLRADVMLSNVKLNLEQVENDIIISNQKLNVLLNLPDSVKISPTDSAAMTRPAVADLLTLLAGTTHDAFAVRKMEENIKLQSDRIKMIRSNNYPVVSLYSAYGLNYPNFLFYPPVDQAYTLGFIGLKIQYNISSIYQNKYKISASRIRLQELQFVKQDVRNNVNQVASSLVIKYQESLNRINVNEQSIEQARVNYKIVSAKYYNQLALLTDLLDADNLYQESRFALVQAQTGAQLIYYQMLYTSGKL
jgi:outer membrane protein TolC